MQETLILVDAQDCFVGLAEKILAHKENFLHRAFSVWVANSKGEVMLQHRAKTKYHSGGLWTNTCCGHPRPGETIEDAVHRRLKEEMGFDCDVYKAAEFVYQADFANGLHEHEYLHVFVGTYDGIPAPNPEEADGWKWVGLDGIVRDVNARPDAYTYWSKIALEKLIPVFRQEQEQY